MKVIKGARKVISNLDIKDKAKIKEELTLQNPKYLSAKKYSKYSRVALPQYLFYFKEVKEGLEVPIGYKIPFRHKIVEDNRITKEVEYPPSKVELREVQEKALKEYIDSEEDNIICLSTGKGKTITALYLAREIKQKTLVIVHKTDLVIGWTKDSKLVFGDKFKVGRIQAKKRNVGEQITVATIQTLNRLTKEELEKLYSEFGLVIVDELHNVSSNMFSLVNNFKSKYRLGLTATPERADGLTPVMNFYFGGFAYLDDKREATEDILPVEVVIKESGVKYVPTIKMEVEGKVVNVPVTNLPYEKRPRVDYHKLEEKVMTDEGYIDLVCKDIYKEFKEGKSIIVFIKQKEHCESVFKHLEEMYRVAPEKMQIFNSDNKDSRSEILRKAEEKEVLITIATVSIATEGTNVKSWEVAFLVSSVNNGKSVEQMVGRIRRTKEGKSKVALVYDYRHEGVYIIKNHGRTRDNRYRELGFKVLGAKKKSLFNVGFNKVKI